MSDQDDIIETPQDAAEESGPDNFFIDILTGNATPKVRERGHDQLPTFAVGQDLSKPAWGAVFRWPC